MSSFPGAIGSPGLPLQGPPGGNEGRATNCFAAEAAEQQNNEVAAKVRKKLEHSLLFSTVEAVFALGEYFVLVLLSPTFAGLLLSFLDNPPSYPRVFRMVLPPLDCYCFWGSS